MTRWARPVAAATLVLTLAACSGGDAQQVDLPDRAEPTSEDSGGSGPTSEVPLPSTTPDGGIPTVGLPTEARAELTRDGDLDRAVRRTWIGYQEALSESLRRHEPTRELRALAGPDIIQMVEERAPGDARDGLTVSLRPLGRLESERTSDDVSRLSVCLWAPSVGFFVEANGEEAEGAAPGWVEYRTVMTGQGGRWTVTQDERTGRSCAGGAP